MKNLTSFAALFMLVTSMAQGQEANWRINFRLGGLYSDPNYGIEALRDVMPTEDYTLYSESGSPAVGFLAGTGISYQLNNRFRLLANLDLNQVNYEVSSSVTDIGTPPANRPIRPNEIILIDGIVNYNYLGVELGTQFSFNNTPQKGAFVGASLGSLFHLGTDWTFMVQYEDERIVEKVDLSTFQEGIDFNQLINWGIHLGYALPINEQLSLQPSLGARGAFNQIVANQGETLKPFDFSFVVNAAWAF